MIGLDGVPVATDGAKVWLITGISRGLGLTLAHAALERGDRVIGTTRDGSPPASLALAASLTTFALDLSVPGAAVATASAALAVHDRIDILVNNAGYGLLGPVEAIDAAAVERQFAVNLFGPIALIRALLPAMRAANGGRIVNIGSVASVAPSAASALYAASKAALTAMSIGLAAELAPFGIRVTVVEPGAFRTDFLDSSSLERMGGNLPGYADTIGAMFARLDTMSGKQPGDPVRAATVLLGIVDMADPPQRLLLGSDACRIAVGRLSAGLAEIDRWRILSETCDRTGA